MFDKKNCLNFQPVR